MMAFHLPVKQDVADAHELISSLQVPSPSCYRSSEAWQSLRVLRDAVVSGGAGSDTQAERTRGPKRPPPTRTVQLLSRDALDQGDAGRTAACHRAASSVGPRPRRTSSPHVERRCLPALRRRPRNGEALLPRALALSVQGDRRSSLHGPE